jgi:hypothetical protein
MDKVRKPNISLFVAFYDSQGYGEGILSPLHEGKSDTMMH